MKLIEDLGMLLPNERVSKKRRYGIYECPFCKVHFKTVTADVKNGKSTKCLSCARKVSTNAKHNDSKTRLYNIWCSIIGRVENKKNKDYEDYGGRGVTICDEWRNNYPSFKKWALQNGYSNSLKIDRIDNDKGYSPDNCRWTTQTIQSRNTRRLRSTNTSGYRGVSWHKKQQKFNSRITVDSITINLGVYDTALEAAKVRDKYITDNNLEHTLNILPTEHTLELKRLIKI